MATLKLLRPGDMGPQAELLQLGLTRAGFNPGKIDGIYGSQTQFAVQKFQTANGLAADSLAGTRTWHALRPYLTGYSIHTVQAGDTIYKLAARYHTTMRAIRFV